MIVCKSAGTAAVDVPEISCSGLSAASLERNFVPSVRADEALQVSDVVGDDRASDRDGLGGEDGVPVEGFACCRGPADGTDLRPETGGSPHRGGVEGEVVEALGQAVETKQAPGRGASAPEGDVEQTAADLVVHDLGEVDDHGLGMLHQHGFEPVGHRAILRPGGVAEPGDDRRIEE